MGDDEEISSKRPTHGTCVPPDKCWQFTLYRSRSSAGVSRTGTRASVLIAAINLTNFPAFHKINFIYYTSYFRSFVRVHAEGYDLNHFKNIHQRKITSHRWNNLEVTPPTVVGSLAMDLYASSQGCGVLDRVRSLNGFMRIHPLDVNRDVANWVVGVVGSFIVTGVVIHIVFNGHGK